MSDAVNSVLNQSHRNLQYIIVDDGSDDETVAVAQTLAELDRRITVISIIHAGSGAARNAGIALSDGDFIAFLDADDKWEPNFLSVMLDNLTASKPSVVAVFCRSNFFTDSTASAGRHEFEPGGYTLNRMLMSWAPPGNGSCLLLRRSCFASGVEFRRDMKSAVDLEMWLRILSASESYEFLGVPDVLTWYRRRSDSISSDLSARFDGLAKILSLYGARLKRHQRISYSFPILMGFRHNRAREARRLYRETLPLGLMFCIVDAQWRRVVLHLLRATLMPQERSRDTEVCSIAPQSTHQSS